MSETLVLISGFSPIMGSILKDLQIQQYIVSFTDIGRQELDKELELLFQQYSITDATFFCNPNNSMSSFEMNLETTTMNQWTRLASTPLPQYYGLGILFADMTSQAWLQSCFYLSFFQYQTSPKEQQIANNFTSYINSSQLAIIISADSSMLIIMNVTKLIIIIHCIILCSLRFYNF